MLSDSGYDEWFTGHGERWLAEGLSLARIVAVDRGRCMATGNAGEIAAEVSGRFIHEHDDPADYPCVGDWVALDIHGGLPAGVIHHVLPRRTWLRRRTAGQTGRHQMIAANVDVAFIVQSCHYDFCPNRLERYLFMVREGGVKPVVVLTKTDMVSAEALEGLVVVVHSVADVDVIATSAYSGDGVDAVKAAVEAGKTCCLLGSSGVGKTTLTNLLLGREIFATQHVSATGEGRHQTTRRQMVILSGGGLLVDTPGMREFGVIGPESEEGFVGEAVERLAGSCRFHDCRHEREPGCAVRAALEAGTLSQERYDNYIRLRKEAAFGALSLHERRHRDKNFSKFVKSVKKQR